MLGYSPLQLVTSKSVVFPEFVTGNEATDSLYDDEMVRKIIERHYKMMKEFREQEFTKKLRKTRHTRSKGNEDVKIKITGMYV